MSLLTATIRGKDPTRRKAASRSAPVAGFRPRRVPCGRISASVIRSLPAMLLPSAPAPSGARARMIPSSPARVTVPRPISSVS